MNKKIIEKIEKLLNKTVENGCTLEETLSASKMVQKLLAKYHVDIKEIQSDVSENIGTETLDTSRQWQILLASVVAKNMCCECYVTTYRGNGKTKRTISFIGKDTDRKAVVSLFDKLVAICKENIKKQNAFYKEIYGHCQGVENSYSIGFLKAIRESMTTQSKALMLVIPDEVKEKLKEKNLVSTFKPKKHTIYSNAFNRGFEDGEKAIENK